MRLPQGVIFLWPGTNASIPINWERVTSLDTRYVKGTGATVNPGVAGGNATHSHTVSGTHSHTMVNHTHTYTLANATGNDTTQSSLESPTGTISQAHTHTGTTGNATDGGLSAVSSSYASLSNDPPYYEVIFITPAKGLDTLPGTAIAMYDSSSIPQGFSFCNGSNGTPDLRNRYPKGAAALGNGGGTGGSTTNVHTLAHTHTVAAHGHGSSTSTSSTYDRRTGSSPNVERTHSHTVTVNSQTVTLASTVDLTTAETVEPEFRKLLPIQNTSGGFRKAPLGIIGMYLGELDSIPYGYTLCDGENGTVDMRGKFLKFANTTEEIGDTGGSATHTHASQTHTHTATGTHTHTGSHSAHSDVSGRNGSGGLNATSASVHAITFSNVTATFNTASTSAEEADNEPLFRTVAYIKLTHPSNAAYLFSLLQN
jgi:hypothetical protein